MTISHTIATLLFAALLLSWASTAVAQIYKTVDADGNVVFTDVPPNNPSGAVELKEYNTYEALQPTNPTVRLSPDPDSDRQTPAREPVSYSKIAIVGPASDETLRRNDGNVSVTVESEPAVDRQSGHEYQVLLDGTIAARGNGTTFLLENTDRGTHQLTVQVIDQGGKILGQSSPVTFHLLRFSALSGAKNRARP